MRTTKLLALVGVAVVALACGGISPTSPAVSVSSDDATALVGAKAAEGPVPTADCLAITTVQLVLLPSPTDIKLKAIYIAGCVPANCAMAPKWDTRPSGRLVPTRDPFVVRVTRTNPPTRVEVGAQAPNGVRGSIVVN